MTGTSVGWRDKIWVHYGGRTHDLLNSGRERSVHRATGTMQLFICDVHPSCMHTVGSPMPIVPCSIINVCGDLVPPSYSSIPHIPIRTCLFHNTIAVKKGIALSRNFKGEPSHPKRIVSKLRRIPFKRNRQVWLKLYKSGWKLRGWGRGYKFITNGRS